MTDPAPKLLIDGSCSFCQGAAAWCRAGQDVEVVDGTQLSDAALAELGTNAAVVERELVLVEDGGATHRGAAAVARLLELRGGWWRWLGRAISAWPISVVAALVYRGVARVRHHLPGRSR